MMARESSWVAEAEAEAQAEDANGVDRTEGSVGLLSRPKRRVSVRSEVDIALDCGAAASFITFDGLASDTPHFALRFGPPGLQDVPLVRMHSECVTGDVFGSLRCDCGSQLKAAITNLKEVGGMLLYLRQEGRGIGLVAKLDAYRLQNRGLDTYAANRALSLPEDARDYGCAAEMLMALGSPRIRLMTNNPDKVGQLRRAGIDVVERVSTPTFVTPFNRPYLIAKQQQTGHALTL